MKPILDKHNEYRCMHDVPLMTWSDAIAANAEEWAKKTGGQMKHSPKDSRQGVGGFGYLGENLAWGVTDTKAVDMWYDEIKLTDGGKVSAFKSGIGHYTQVVWKTSTSLGCGVFKTLIVCQYGPGGNMGGQFSSHVLPPTKSASQCGGASGGSPSPPRGSGRARPSPRPRRGGTSGRRRAPSRRRRAMPGESRRRAPSRRRRAQPGETRRRSPRRRGRAAPRPRPTPAKPAGGGSAGKPGTFREFELSYTVRNPAKANSAQLAEMTILSGGQRVGGRPKVRNNGGRSPGRETPDMLADGNTRTKWLDFNKKPVALYFSKGVSADSVKLTTANDAPERDPTNFKLKGMTSDGKWKTVLEKKNALPTGRFQTVTFNFDGSPSPAPSPAKPPKGSNEGAGKPKPNPPAGAKEGMCTAKTPGWKCKGRQCSGGDMSRYMAGGAPGDCPPGKPFCMPWCLPASNALCAKPDPRGGSECSCPTRTPHACGRCPVTAAEAANAGRPAPRPSSGSGKPAGGSGGAAPASSGGGGGSCTKPKTVPKCGKCANSGQCVSGCFC